MHQRRRLHTRPVLLFRSHLQEPLPGCVRSERRLHRPSAQGIVPLPPRIRRRSTRRMHRLVLVRPYSVVPYPPFAYILFSGSRSAIRYCDSNPCHPTAKCVDTPGSYSCFCPPNYIGDPYQQGCRHPNACPNGDLDCPDSATCLPDKNGEPKCSSKYLFLTPPPLFSFNSSLGLVLKWFPFQHFQILATTISVAPMPIALFLGTSRSATVRRDSSRSPTQPYNVFEVNK